MFARLFHLDDGGCDVWEHVRGYIRRREIEVALRVGSFVC